MCKIGKPTETESRLFSSLGRGVERGIGVKANGHEVSFWVYESILELVVMITKLCKCAINL